MSLFEVILAQVDPMTAGLMVAFWLRWETWRTSHDGHHARIAEHLTLRTDP